MGWREPRGGADTAFRGCAPHLASGEQFPGRSWSHLACWGCRRSSLSILMLRAAAAVAGHRSAAGCWRTASAAPRPRPAGTRCSAREMRPEGRSQASECCRGRPRRLVRAVRGRRRLASCDETIQDRPSKDGIWGMSVKPLETQGENGQTARRERFCGKIECRQALSRSLSLGPTIGGRNGFRLTKARWRSNTLTAERGRLTEKVPVVGSSGLSNVGPPRLKCGRVREGY